MTEAGKTPVAGAAVRRLMEEARRRFESFAVHHGKTLPEAWIGLGTPSEYRSALDGGWMTPLNGVATRRVMNWYLLTGAGLELYRSMFLGSEDGSNRVYRDGLAVDRYSVGHDNARNRVRPLIEWILARGADGFAFVPPGEEAVACSSVIAESEAQPIPGFEGQFRSEHGIELSDPSAGRIDDIPIEAVGDGAELTLTFPASPVGLTLGIDRIWDIAPREDDGIGFLYAGRPYALLPSLPARS